MLVTNASSLSKKFCYKNLMFFGVFMWKPHLSTDYTFRIIQILFRKWILAHCIRNEISICCTRIFYFDTFKVRSHNRSLYRRNICFLIVSDMFSTHACSNISFTYMCQSASLRINHPRLTHAFLSRIRKWMKSSRLSEKKIGSEMTVRTIVAFNLMARRKWGTRFFLQLDTRCSCF